MKQPPDIQPGSALPTGGTPLRQTAPMLPDVVTAKSPIGIGSTDDPSNPLAEVARHLANIKWALFVIAAALLALVVLEITERTGK
jgi:hypothetical protein